MWKKKNTEGLYYKKKHTLHCGATKTIEKNKIYKQGLETDPCTNGN